MKRRSQRYSSLWLRRRRSTRYKLHINPNCRALGPHKCSNDQVTEGSSSGFLPKTPFLTENRSATRLKLGICYIFHIGSCASSIKNSILTIIARGIVHQIICMGSISVTRKKTVQTIDKSTNTPFISRDQAKQALIALPQLEPSRLPAPAPPRQPRSSRSLQGPSGRGP